MPDPTATTRPNIPLPEHMRVIQESARMSTQREDLCAGTTHAEIMPISEEALCAFDEVPIELADGAGLFDLEDPYDEQAANVSDGSEFLDLFDGIDLDAADEFGR